MLTVARPAASSTSSCCGVAPTEARILDRRPPFSSRSSRDPTVKAATGCVLVATACTDTTVSPPTKALGMTLPSVLPIRTRIALGSWPLAGSNSGMPPTGGRVGSHSLQSTVTSAAEKVSRIFGRLASAADTPAALARLQSAAAPVPSTCTADSAARSAAFWTSRFM